MNTYTYEQLEEEFENIKAELREIDQRYSTNYLHVVIDLPDTLGLEPMEYTEPTQQELEDRAEQATEAWYVNACNKENASYTDKLQELNARKSKLVADSNARIAKIEIQRNEEIKKRVDKIINNGVYVASYLAKVIDSINDKFDELVDAEESTTETNVDNVDDEIANILTIKTQNLTSLATERQAKMDALVAKYVSEEAKQAERVFKYNNQITERENRFQASKERTYELARTAESQRSLEAIRLRHEIGEMGMNDIISAEKLTVCRVFFAKFRRADALTILNIDSFFVDELGVYYDYLYDYVDSMAY